MTEIYRSLSIGFYFDPGVEEFREERLDMARRILAECDAKVVETNRTLESGIVAVVFLALVPAGTAYLHHGFESRFNKAWPDGCGAGFMEELGD